VASSPGDWTVDFGTGTLEFSGGHARAASGGGDVAVSRDVGAGANVRVELTIGSAPATNDGNIRVVARISDVDNYVAAWYTNGIFQIRKKVGGTTTLWNSPGGKALDTGDIMALEIVNDQAKTEVSYDGGTTWTVYHSGFDVSDVPASGGIGLLLYDNATYPIEAESIYAENV